MENRDRIAVLGCLEFCEVLKNTLHGGGFSLLSELSFATRFIFFKGSIGASQVMLVQETQEVWIYLIPGSGRSPGGGHGNSLQYSCLENLHGQRNLVGYSALDCKQSDTTKAT